MFAGSGCILVQACAVAFATCGAARKADMQNNALRLRLHKLMCKYQNIEILQNPYYWYHYQILSDKVVFILSNFDENQRTPLQAVHLIG